MHNKEVRLVYATVGLDGEANKAKWRIVTSPKNERKGISLPMLKDAARQAVAQVMPAAKVNVTDPAFVEGAQTEAPIMIDVRGGSYAELAPTANQVAQILRTTPGVQDVQVKYTPGKPELRVEIDRQRAADQGLTVAQVAMALRGALEGDADVK